MLFRSETEAKTQHKKEIAAGEMRLLCGRAGTGKTAQALSAAKKFLADGGNPNRLWIIVPDAETASKTAEKIFSTPNGRAKSGASTARPLVGVQIHTLPSLCLAIFDLAHVPRPRLLPVGLRPVMVRDALRDVLANTRQFRRLINRVGYRRLLTDFVSESLHNRVWPEQLAKVAQRLRDQQLGEERGLSVRAELLAALLERYLHACDNSQMLDPDRLPEAAANWVPTLDRESKRIGEFGGGGGPFGLVIIDEFTQFSDAELTLITAVTAHADHAICTLCLPAPPKYEPANADPLRSFAYSKRMYNGLDMFAQKNGKAWKLQELQKPRRFHSQALAHLERDLFHAEPRDLERKPLPPSKEREIRLAEARAALDAERSILRFIAPSIQEECEWIAGEIRRLHVQKGVPLALMAVVHRDSADYDPLLRSTFLRAGVPIQRPRTVTLANTPLWWLVRDLMGAALRDPADPGGARSLLTNPLFEVTTTATIQLEGTANGLWTQREWLDATNYRDPRAVALVGGIAAVVQRLRNAAMAAEFSPTEFSARLLAGLDRLGVTKPPLTLGPHAKPLNLLDSGVAEMIRERAEVVRACRTIIRTTAAMLAGDWRQLNRLGPAGLTAPEYTPPTPIRPLDAPQSVAGESVAGENLVADGADIANGGLDGGTAVGEILGTLNLDEAGRFWESVEEAARLHTIRTHVEWCGAGVIAGDIGEVVLPSDLQVIFVAGLIQGVFPPPPITDPVLPDRDRLCLSQAGVWYEERAALREYEDFLFYRAVTRASTQVYLSFPERDRAGNETMPSLFVRDVAAAFGIEFEKLPLAANIPEMAVPRATTDDLSADPGEVAERAWQAVETEAGRIGGNVDRALAALCDHPDLTLPWRRLQTPAQLLRWTVRTLWRPLTLNAESLAAWHAAAAVWDRLHETLPTLRMAAQAGFIDPHQARLSPAARNTLRQEERILSASGINTFANCPYKFFARYHLGLEEPEKAEPDPRIWGSLHHLVLEELGRHMLDGTVPSEPAVAARWAVDRLNELAHDTNHGFPKLLVQRRFQAELRLQAEKLRAFVAIDVERRRSRAVLPIGFEVPFGFGPKSDADLAKLPPGPNGEKPLYSPEPLTLSDPVRGVSLRIRGYIDLLEATQFPDSRGRRWATVVDYKSGMVWRMARRLREFLNAKKMVLETAPADQYVGPDLGEPLDFQIPIYIMAVRDLFGFEVAGAFFYSLAKREKRGIHRHDQVDLLAEGEISKYDHLSTLRFEDVVTNSRETLLCIGEKIDAGEIAINPHDCSFCEFRDLCRFDKKQVDLLRSRRGAAEKLAHDLDESAHRVPVPALATHALPS